MTAVASDVAAKSTGCAITQARQAPDTATGPNVCNDSAERAGDVRCQPFGVMKRIQPTPNWPLPAKSWSSKTIFVAPVTGTGFAMLRYPTSGSPGEAGTV